MDTPERVLVPIRPDTAGLQALGAGLIPVASGLLPSSAAGDQRVPLDPEIAIQAMTQVMEHGEALVVVGTVDVPALAAPAAVSVRPLFDVILASHRAVSAADAGADCGQRAGSSPRESLASLPGGEQEAELLARVRSWAATVFGHGDAAAIEPGRVFRDLGLDSLAAVQFRNLLSAETGVSFPPRSSSTTRPQRRSPHM